MKGVSMKNNGLMILGTLGVIIIGFIAPLIVWLSKDTLTPEERAVIASLFNFEISLLIVCVLINLIPFLGQLISLVLCVMNIVYGIQAFIAVKDHKPFHAITIYEFVK